MYYCLNCWLFPQGRLIPETATNRGSDVFDPRHRLELERRQFEARHRQEVAQRQHPVSFSL